MNKILILAAVTAGTFLLSCSRKAPDFAGSIPDKAFAVVSMHPMDIHTKGKVNTLDYLKEKVEDEFLEQVLDDPMSTGLMLDAYMYVFARMEEEAPVIGVVSGVKDVEQLESTFARIDEGISEQFTETELYTQLQLDEEGIIAWDTEKMVLLYSTDFEEFDEAYWKESLDWMFNPVKEESVVSLVDFKDFQGKMKDLNLWFSSDDMMKVVEQLSDGQMEGLPISLYNNYTHMFCEFANGEMNITGETNFSEEVQKNLDEVLVMKPSLNQEILKMTPGGDLLMALAVSMDLEKVKKLVENFAPDQLVDSAMSSNLEKNLGVPPEKLLQAFTGDFTIAVNGLDEEAMIPIEVFIGIGVESDEIQKQLMNQVEQMMPVEEEGDFFVINVQGTEIYSGILHDTWVITNAKGYRESAREGGLDKSLLDSEFDRFSGGSMGMYLNLDLDSYPGLVTGLLEQNEKSNWIRQLTEPFDHLGISAGDQQSLITLKTNRPDENSLYTLLKMPESQQ